MPSARPISLVVLGCLCTSAACVLLVVLLLNRRDELALVRAGYRGDEAALAQLEKQNLHLGANVALNLGLLAAMAACLVVMGTSGLGLVRAWPPSRWAIVAAAAGAIILALSNTVFRLSSLHVPGERLSVVPLLLDAGLILLSINLLGTMFLPNLVRALTEDLHSRGEDDPSSQYSAREIL